MGSKRSKRSELDRLSVKTLDDRFLTELQQGLSCSPFESEAILNLVREIFAPLMGSEKGAGPPGTMSVIAVDAEEPAGKPLALIRECSGDRFTFSERHRLDMKNWPGVPLLARRRDPRVQSASVQNPRRWRTAVR